MKNINKYIALGLSAVAFTSCDSLDTEYLGYYVTTEQKEHTLEQNPEMALAAVTGIYSSFSQYCTVYSNHFDFGYPAIMIGLDLQGTDLITVNSGYNWFSYWTSFSSPTPQGTPSGMAWYHIYDQIFTENAVLPTIARDTEDPQLKFFRAQALAARAFDYWVLAQLYQFNYATSKDKPCVPVLVDEYSPAMPEGTVGIATTAEAANDGCPRATVETVYNQILWDLDEAIELLSSTTVTPDAVIDSKPKRLVSLATAYGIRARVYLTMHEYAKAAADAQKAIDNFGGTPYSIAEVSTPTFTSLDDHSWMWGIAIAETDRVVTSGIINFPSHMGSLNYGYCTVGAWKWCNMNLYNAIPSTDVRKGWFLDENLQSKNLNKQQQNYMLSYASTLEPYTQVKFNSYQGVLNQSTNASDIPLMRIEEMYYILAEGLAMSGNTAQAKTVFENFVKTYRNPKYAMNASSAEEMQDAIYQDRRVEFFGEGLSWFDLQRLGLTIDRTGANFPAAYTYIIEPDDNVRVYCIPQGEVNGNPQISDADNNPSSSRPSPIS